jgi:hypothetical protein
MSQGKAVLYAVFPVSRARGSRCGLHAVTLVFSQFELIKIEPKSNLQILLFWRGYKFNVWYLRLAKIAASPPRRRIAEANQIAAYKTLTCTATNRKVAGSIPNELIFKFT